MNTEEEDFCGIPLPSRMCWGPSCAPVPLPVFLPDGDQGERRGQRKGGGPRCHPADHHLCLGISRSDFAPALELSNDNCHMQNVFLHVQKSFVQT